MKKRLPIDGQRRKLVLNSETLHNLGSVYGAYCSNSTLSAQVSNCSPDTFNLKPMCAPPVD